MRLSSTSLVISMLFCTPKLLAGWSSNGGEFDADQENVWFLGDEAVEYCIEFDADNFRGYDLASEVAESLGQWKSFFIKYGLDSKTFGDSLEFPDGRRRKVSLEFRKVEKCERPDEQLRFLFGVSPGSEHNLKWKLGAAIRKHYNHTTFRTGGFIWIRKKISSEGVSIGTRPPIDRPWDPDSLRSMLLHELGHVFGMRHDSVNIMTSDIVSQILGVDGYLTKPRYVPAQIESTMSPVLVTVGSDISLCHATQSLVISDDGECHNETLPQELIDAFGWQRIGGQHSIRWVVTTATTSELIITDAVSGDIRRFPLISSDELSGQRSSLEGPGVFTEWIYRSISPRPELVYRRRTLSPGASILPFRGHFVVAGQFWGIVIRKRNHFLEVTTYNPNNGTWWNGTWARNFLLRDFPFFP